MPLFKSNDPAATSTNGATDGPNRRGSMFSRAKSPPAESASTTSGASRGSFFARRTASDEHLHSHVGKDPSVLAARKKVSDAEAAEREADKALREARLRVKEALEHVKYLEKEAMEEARRARAKQAEAKAVTKSARGLGRHN